MSAIRIASRRAGSVLCLALLGLLPAGCVGSHGSPDGRETPHATALIDHHAPDEAEMAEGRFDLGQPLGSIALRGGVWEGNGGATRVTFLQEYTRVGDLYDDGGEEAVAVLRALADGVETLHLAVVDQRDGLVHTIAATTIGQADELRDVTIEGTRIVVQVQRSGREERLVWHLTDEELVLESSA